MAAVVPRPKRRATHSEPAVSSTQASLRSAMRKLLSYEPCAKRRGEAGAAEGGSELG